MSKKGKEEEATCILNFVSVMRTFLKRREGNVNSRIIFICFAVIKLYRHFLCKINASNLFFFAFGYIQTNFGRFLHHCKNITLDNKIKGVLLIGK